MSVRMCAAHNSEWPRDSLECIAACDGRDCWTINAIEGDKAPEITIHPDYTLIRRDELAALRDTARNAENDIATWRRSFDYMVDRKTEFQQRAYAAEKELRERSDPAMVIKTDALITRKQAKKLKRKWKRRNRIRLWIKRVLR